MILEVQQWGKAGKVHKGDANRSLRESQSMSMECCVCLYSGLKQPSKIKRWLLQKEAASLGKVGRHPLILH